MIPHNFMRRYEQKTESVRAIVVVLNGRLLSFIYKLCCDLDHSISDHGFLGFFSALEHVNPNSYDDDRPDSHLLPERLHVQVNQAGLE